jgi:hypothetical protein
MPIMIIMIPANAVQPIAHPLGFCSDMFPPLGFPPWKCVFARRPEPPDLKK